MQAGEHVTPTLRLLRPLSQGAMGGVWAAEDLALGAQVAVKLMTPEYAEDPVHAARFRKEAQAAAKLDSPHVTKVLGEGITDAGELYIVMELLEGETLRARMAREGAMPLEWVTSLVTQTARALGRAHELGIIHRDIKPENLFLVAGVEEPFVKVLDFGIAKLSQSSRTKVTATGAFLGTPLYMSPEQFYAAKSVDFRTDLWALGVVAYQALTGRLPFLGESVWVVGMAVRAGKYPPPSAIRPELPPAVDAWIARALQTDPAARFTSASEMAEALEGAAGTMARPSAAPAARATPAPAAEPARGVDLRLITHMDEPAIHVAQEASGGAEVLTLSVPNVRPSALAFNPRSSARLYLLCEPGAVLCWDFGAPRLRWWTRLPVLPLCVAAAPGFVAVGCEDGRIRLLDAATGKIENTLRGHKAAVRSLAVHPNGQTLASGADDATVRLWNSASGETLHAGSEHTDSVQGVVFSPDGAVLASGSADGTVRLWGPALARLWVLPGQTTSEVWGVAFSKGVVAAASGDGSVRLWDAGSYAPLSPLTPAQRVISVAFGAGTEVLTAGSVEGGVLLWDAAEGGPIRVLLAYPGLVAGLAVSRYGRYIAAAWDRGLVRVARLSAALGSA